MVDCSKISGAYSEGVKVGDPVSGTDFRFQVHVGEGFKGPFSGISVERSYDPEEDNYQIALTGSFGEGSVVGQGEIVEYSVDDLGTSVAVFDRENNQLRIEEDGDITVTQDFLGGNESKLCHAPLAKGPGM